jgi:alpha-glucan,water dikinase
MLPPLPLQLTVEINQQGDQIIHLLTDLQAGALLLHWGVEGGRDYKGGWRLPSGPGCQPPGTRAYKNRALQTPWVRQSDGETSALTIELKGEEASDAFNFVLKDEATNTWWDNNGSNFTVSLRPHTSADSSSSGANGNTTSSSSVMLPKDLCDKWSWMVWDQAGRPKGRGNQAASESYEASIKDMEKLLAMGRPIDELWAVANGTIPYKDYASKHGLKAQAPSSPSQSPSATGPVPEDLLAVQAYILWEKAGKPDGADFSEAARRSIEEEVKKGSSFEQVAAR